LDKSEYGVIPRAIEAVFGRIGEYRKVDVFCSFLQIYNEKIYDLLQVCALICRKVTSQKPSAFTNLRPRGCSLKD
jgi:hypothetical protein